MLAHGVMIEPYVVGQLTHTDRARRVDDVAEQAMARRITEGSGLALDFCLHHSSLLE
jgi:hypothetical protein